MLNMCKEELGTECNQWLLGTENVDTQKFLSLHTMHGGPVLQLCETL